MLFINNPKGSRESHQSQTINPTDQCVIYSFSFCEQLAPITEQNKQFEDDRLIATIFRCTLSDIVKWLLDETRQTISCLCFEIVMELRRVINIILVYGLS
jgi:hypothetical protein